MYQTISQVVTQSGLWDGTRRQSHAFLLSPSVFAITHTQHQELNGLGVALFDCLLGLSHIAVIAYDPKVNYDGAWRFARRVFSAGVPHAYVPLQAANFKHIPRLLKVDVMVDNQGNFKIAEIDGHNKHGLGYATLVKRIREAIYPKANALPGTVSLLAQEIRRLGHEHITIFYGDQERFYIPEFEIAADELRKHSIHCSVISEMEAKEESLIQGLFLDLPFLYRKKELYDYIIPAYQEGAVQFIIPPKPFLGSKGTLALLRNDSHNEHLEAILCSFIKRSSLETIRRYTPEILLIGRHAERIEATEQRMKEKRYVLKESISSGMKGTIFSDDPSFEKVLARACKAHANWIIQKEVTNMPQELSWYETDNNKVALKTSQDWFMRVTLQYVNRQLGDIVVTACRNKAVHGAKNCIQIGSVVS